MRTLVVGLLLGAAAVLSLAVATPATAQEGDHHGIVTGRHRCKFAEDGAKYNRVCTVTQQPDGTMLVKAPGTKLNPDIGFDVVLTGAPDAYDAEVTMRTFATCKGKHKGKVKIEASRDDYWYVIALPKGCGVWIKGTTY